MWQSAPIPFVLPEFHMRIVESDPEYRTILVPNEKVDPVIGGHFERGVWRGHVWANGCDVERGPVDLEKVKDAPRTTITGTLRKFHSHVLKPRPATKKPRQGRGF